METIKIEIQSIEDGTLLINTFDINNLYKRFSKYNNNNNDIIYYYEPYTLKYYNKSDDFITKIVNWFYDDNNYIFSNTKNVKINEIYIYNETNKENYIKYSIIKNDLDRVCDNIKIIENLFSIINLSYKFTYNNLLYNDNVINKIYFYDNNNVSLWKIINTIISHISYNEYNKKFNKEYLKIDQLIKIKEELNQLIDKYNSGIKTFISGIDANYKKIEENNEQFKTDLSQRFELIDTKINKLTNNHQDDILINKINKKLDLIESNNKSYLKKQSEIINSYNEINVKLITYQQGIKDLSLMNKMLIFVIVACYYLFLFISYY